MGNASMGSVLSERPVRIKTPSSIVDKMDASCLPRFNPRPKEANGKRVADHQRGQGLATKANQTAAASQVGILVVDDEPAVRALLQIVLQRQGFVVWLAGNGQEALEVYQQRPSAIAFVLLDVCMPKLDGPQALAAMQRIQPAVRCCFMSGCTGKYTEEELLQRGAEGVFAKPFRLAELAAALWELATRVESSGAGRATRTENCFAGAL